MRALKFIVVLISNTNMILAKIAACYQNWIQLNLNKSAELLEHFCPRWPKLIPECMMNCLLFALNSFQTNNSKVHAARFAGKFNCRELNHAEIGSILKLKLALLNSDE